MTSVQSEFKKGVDHYLAERFSGAERCLRKVVKQEPNHGDALHLLGLIALRSGQAKAGGRLDDARAAYLEALEITPDHIAALAGLAGLTAYLGDDDEAEALYQRLVTLLLAQLDRRENKLDDACRRLQALGEDGEDGGIAFELGRILDLQGDYDAVFAAFERANTALDEARNAGRYDGSAYRTMIDEIAITTNADAVATWPDRHAPVFDDGLAEPIFFVGFPRSGTTLMEQILDAHDDLVSLEEQPLLDAARRSLSADSPYPAALTGIAPDNISALRQAYWQAANDAELSGRARSRLQPRCRTMA